MNSANEQEQAVSSAFSAQSPLFDAITTGNPMEVLYRNLAREQVMRYAKRGQYLLELNCGTGLDAVFFAGQGLQVYATDNSEGMLAQLQQKITLQGLQNKISWQRCSFNHLNQLAAETKFDHVFSNFGGLNCAENMEQVIAQLDQHIQPGGMAHFVMIAPICLWELGAVLKGRFRYAFRRLSKKGVRSQVEGHYFNTYYYSLSQIRKAFGTHYDVVELRSLGCFLPPTFKSELPARRPRLFNLLKRVELRLNNRWPFNRIGDLYVVSVKKK